jgi:hypothetical protein
VKNASGCLHVGVVEELCPASQVVLLSCASPDWWIVGVLVVDITDLVFPHDTVSHYHTHFRKNNGTLNSLQQNNLM